MPVNIHNKEYFTVPERAIRAREIYPDHRMTTSIVHRDEEFVVVKAMMMLDGEVFSTGHAEEERASSNINKTSALENCETSAVGRCYANTGHPDLMGTSVASAEEVAQAISQQDLTEALRRGIEHGKAFVRLSDSIQAIKDGIGEGRLDVANEAWKELTEEEKRLLWVAPSKGGPFTTEERNIMKSTEFREA